MPPPSRSTWPDLLEEGERLHAHLLQHYEEMVGDTHMEHFDIHYTSTGTSCDAEYLSERYRDEIKEDIRPWIQEEHQSGRLFDRENWKPFRDAWDYTSMYYGYRHLFVYNGAVYFQLTIRDQAVDGPDGKLQWYILFEAALYGWKEEGSELLAPSGHGVLEGNRMPDREWSWK